MGRVHKASRPTIPSAPVAIKSWAINKAHLIAHDGFPVTPAELRHTSIATHEEWIAAGKEHYENMRKILGENGFLVKTTTRVLDFGCSSGRTIRLWRDEPVEVWGCEIDEERTRWCQTHLTPRFHFVQTTTLPHLPFEDNFFDLVYAGSVFTHISAHQDAWLMELRRILRPGGFAYLTIHDETTWRMVKSGRGKALESVLAQLPEGEFTELNYDFFSLGEGPASQTFYRSSFFRDFVGQYFIAITYHPLARGYQSALVGRKPASLSSAAPENR